MLHPRVHVQAVGFHKWKYFWLGIIVTPWCMNVILAKGQPSKWKSIPEGRRLHYPFPAGIYDFISVKDRILGEYQMCSLMSPLEEVVSDHDMAVEIAKAALEELMKPEQEPELGEPIPAIQPEVMSYLGAIRFVLTTDGCSVSDVSIEPAKELRIEKLLCGKRVEDALALLPPLFALCPDSQTAAAAVACDVAQNSVPSQEVLVKARFANHLELINEGVRFFALQCAGEDYRAAKIKSVIRVRELVSELREMPYEDQTKRNKLWSELRGEVSYLLLDGFSESWEQDLFNGTITPSKDSLTAFFDKISSHRSRGYTSGPLLDKPTAFILQALKERGCWKNGSLESDVRSLTGPVARMRNNPTVAGLLMSDGNTNYTRFVARFIEVLSAADLIRMPLETIAAMELGKGSAVSLVQNSRGILLHAAKIIDGVIENYRILTPTEINVVDSEWFKKTLLNLKAKDAEELKKLAELTILSFDPCTQMDGELKNA